jgi:hypothetical protein
VGRDAEPGEDHGVARHGQFAGAVQALVPAEARRRRIGPFVALVVVNVVGGLAAVLTLVRSAVLPSALALHGALMIVAWGCLLPLGGIVARYFKVTPAQDFPAAVDNLFWWRMHRTLQYGGLTTAAVALFVVLRQTGGQFDTAHGRCGLVVMVLAGLQLASPLFRGSKGGPTEPGARPDDARTWRGDHFDMTLRRRLFEAWHKPVGWLLIALAQATLLLGAQLAGGPDWLVALLGLMTGALAFAVADCRLHGRWIDTHAAIWGRVRRDPGAD